MNHTFVSGAITTMLTLLLVGTGTALEPHRQNVSVEDLRQARRALAHRPRRIIMNNDGCDVLYFPKEERTTVEAFLAKRTTPLAGTHVAAIAFCPTSSGFSYFTHDTKTGSLLSRSGEEFGLQPDTRNIAQDLIDIGTDCFEAVIQFGHKHKMEVFWSLRMNDTHDSAHQPGKPYFLFPPLKYEHPDWLVGEPIKRTPYRMELNGRDLRVFVEGQLRIDAPDALGPRSGYAKNEVAFGAANSGMRGEAYWDDVRVRSAGTSCTDLVVRVTYESE